MASISLSFLLTVVSFCLGDVIVQERTFTFERVDNGRYWPMPDNMNPGILMVHGRHCYDIMVETAGKGGEMTKMHRTHCQGLLKRIINFIDSNPTYQVNPWICEGLTGTKWQSDETLKSSKPTGLPDQSKSISNLLSPDNGIHYGINYDYNQKKPQPVPKQVNLLSPDNGISYGINYDNKNQKPVNLLSPDNGISYGINYDNKNQKPANLLSPDNGISYGINYDNKNQKPMNLLSPDNGIHYGINYDKDHQKQQPLPKLPKPVNLLSPDNGISYGINYDNKNQKPTNLLSPDNGISYGINYDNKNQKPTNLLSPDNGISYGINYDNKNQKPANLLSPDNGIGYGINYDNKNQKPANLLSPDNGIGYGINYDNKNQKPANLLSPDNGIHYGINYEENQKKQQSVEKPVNPLTISHQNISSPSIIHPYNGFNRGIDFGIIKDQDQNDLFTRLMADNFGDLLMNNWMNPQSTTKSEREYLARWESQSATVLGAVGLYCHVKGDLSVVRHMANVEI